MLPKPPLAHQYHHVITSCACDRIWAHRKKGRSLTSTINTMRSLHDSLQVGKAKAVD